jgi:hypothetical protein
MVTTTTTGKQKPRSISNTVSDQGIVVSNGETNPSLITIGNTTSNSSVSLKRPREEGDATLPATTTVSTAADHRCRSTCSKNDYKDMDKNKQPCSKKLLHNGPTKQANKSTILSAKDHNFVSTTKKKEQEEDNNDDDDDNNNTKPPKKQHHNNNNNFTNESIFVFASTDSQGESSTITNKNNNNYNNNLNNNHNHNNARDNNMTANQGNKRWRGKRWR